MCEREREVRESSNKHFFFIFLAHLIIEKRERGERGEREREREIRESNNSHFFCIFLAHLIIEKRERGQREKVCVKERERERE